ncbi:hypothetical protein DL766_006145 [Monosporascus sp. MC13-8B]|uniref:DUF4604 domain-containing protein n=1 Tax=Monosporascus cannonballus TaxID=155416 RepID=A0ABY0HFB8_9PEZI|nr:hypothetical protein DL762_003334 [Monosporascus cannonballus]RYP00540.1 hypothetical protein DL763_000737 [Monosporascus cannonballus]RYP27901.1 hypothetical protein DL766_006145 [Monosporascus sp. MC13-8B]
MSQSGPKITSKNLTYDTTLPPFLARLRGQQRQYSEDGPDPILAARRRPQGKPWSASEEAEDAPVVVDERGNVVQLRDGAIVDDNGDAGVGQNEGGAEVEKADGDAVEKRGEEEEEQAGKRDAEKVAGIGAGRKRKVGRVVGGAGSGSGGEDDRDGDGGDSNVSKEKSARADDADAKAKSTATAPTKKKMKKIKLSFGDDGE